MKYVYKRKNNQHIIGKNKELIESLYDDAKCVDKELEYPNRQQFNNLKQVLKQDKSREVIDIFEAFKKCN